jgi:hypothetical protein
MDVFIKGQKIGTNDIHEFRKTAWDYVCAKNNGTHPTHIKVGEFTRAAPTVQPTQNAFNQIFNTGGCKSCGR